MPELIEVETYRRLAERTLDRPIARVHAPDRWFLKTGTSPEMLADTLEGASFRAAERIGKLLLLRADGAVLGVRFGMSGRLIVDGQASIDRLLYASPREDPVWDRFSLCFADGGSLVVRDPRRLGGVQLDPDIDALGPDALDLSVSKLRDALLDSKAPLKARLLDQSRIAGLGNPLVDEILWRCGLDPARPAGGLTPTEVRRAQREVAATVRELLERGGSHTGDLMSERVRGGRCPRDGAELERRTIGGRTTYSCPWHQR